MRPLKRLVRGVADYQDAPPALSTMIILPPSVAARVVLYAGTIPAAISLRSSLLILFPFHSALELCAALPWVFCALPAGDSRYVRKLPSTRFSFCGVYERLGPFGDGKLTEAFPCLATSKDLPLPDCADFPLKIEPALPTFATYSYDAVWP